MISCQYIRFQTKAIIFSPNSFLLPFSLISFLTHSWDFFFLIQPLELKKYLLFYHAKISLTSILLSFHTATILYYSDSHLPSYLVTWLFLFQTRTLWSVKGTLWRVKKALLTLILGQLLYTQTVPCKLGHMIDLCPLTSLMSDSSLPTSVALSNAISTPLPVGLLVLVTPKGSGLWMPKHWFHPEEGK